MWILLLAVVGLVAGAALVLGLERRYARPILVFALLGLVVGALIFLILSSLTLSREQLRW